MTTATGTIDDLKHLTDRELGLLCDMHHRGAREVTKAESKAIFEQAPHVWIARLSAPVWARTMLGYSRGMCDAKGKPSIKGQASGWR